MLLHQGYTLTPLEPLGLCDNHPRLIQQTERNEERTMSDNRQKALQAAVSN